MIVEIFYVRLKRLSEVLTNRFRWKKDLRDSVYKICATLINQHILQHSLCLKDGPEYKLRRKQLYRDGIQAIKKRAGRKEPYWRLRAAILALDGDFDEVEEI